MNHPRIKGIFIFFSMEFMLYYIHAIELISVRDRTGKVR